MGIPSKEAFDEWKKLASENANNELAVEYCADIQSGKKLVAETADNFVRALYANRAQHALRLEEHAVTRWLFSQSAYKRAEELMFRRIKDGGEIEEVMAVRVRRLSDSPNPRTASFLARRYAESTSPRNYWPSQIIIALDEYLHTDLDAKYAARRQAKSKIEKIFSLFDEVCSDLKDEISDSIIQSTRKRLEIFQTTASMLPRRDQKNKKERRFVRRIAYENMRYGNHTAKPQVIAELMTLECIHRQLDRRTIDRICSDMAKERKERAELAMAPEADKREKDVMAKRAS